MSSFRERRTEHYISQLAYDFYRASTAVVEEAFPDEKTRRHRLRAAMRAVYFEAKNEVMRRHEQRPGWQKTKSFGRYAIGILAGALIGGVIAESTYEWGIDNEKSLESEKGIMHLLLGLALGGYASHAIIREWRDSRFSRAAYRRAGEMSRGMTAQMLRKKIGSLNYF